MVPMQTPLGLSLAEVLPFCLSALGVEGNPARLTEERKSPPSFPKMSSPVKTAVVIVVDGLGYSNLKSRKGYARFLWSQRMERIETVAPSTTGAALTTITTGVLPGEHGLIGYRIRDPRSGALVTTLNEWSHVSQTRDWQQAETVFERASASGTRSAVIGRHGHRKSGLTDAILTGADYLSAASIPARFQQAEQAVRSGDYGIVYVYVDELDREAHSAGWLSDGWSELLESLDSELRNFVAGLPPRIGVTLTADHGIVDVPQSRHVLYDEDTELMRDIAMVGGEPRFRYLYLTEGEASSLGRRADEVAERWRAAWGSAASIHTRAEAIDSGMFGTVQPDVRERMGDVIVIANDDRAFYSAGPGDVKSRGMIGQHGGLSPAEIGIPLVWMGAFA